MKKNNVQLLKAAAVIAALTAGSSSLGEGFVNPFGDSAAAVPMTDALVDAARSFDKIDINDDGMIDVEEYAAQRIVYAQLARLNRQVSIDGQGLTSIAVPDSTPFDLGPSERAALDAVARRDFHMKAFGSPGLDEAMWQDAKLEQFTAADANGDGELREAELAIYASGIAGDLTAALPGS